MKRRKILQHHCDETHEEAACESLLRIVVGLAEVVWLAAAAEARRDAVDERAEKHERHVCDDEGKKYSIARVMQGELKQIKIHFNIDGRNMYM